MVKNFGGTMNTPLYAQVGQRDPYLIVIKNFGGTMSTPLYAQVGQRDSYSIKV